MPLYPHWAQIYHERNKLSETRRVHQRNLVGVLGSVPVCGCAAQQFKKKPTNLCILLLSSFLPIFRCLFITSNRITQIWIGLRHTCAFPSFALNEQQVHTYIVLAGRKKYHSDCRIHKCKRHVVPYIVHVKIHENAEPRKKNYLWKCIFVRCQSVVEDATVQLYSCTLYIGSMEKDLCVCVCERPMWNMYLFTVWSLSCFSRWIYIFSV